MPPAPGGERGCGELSPSSSCFSSSSSSSSSSSFSSSPPPPPPPPPAAPASLTFLLAFPPLSSRRTRARAQAKQSPPPLWYASGRPSFLLRFPPQRCDRFRREGVVGSVGQTQQALAAEANRTTARTLGLGSPHLNSQSDSQSQPVTAQLFPMHTQASRGVFGQGMGRPGRKTKETLIGPLLS